MRLQNYYNDIKNEVLFYFKEQGITLNIEDIDIEINTIDKEPKLNINIKINEDLRKFIRKFNYNDYSIPMEPELNIPFIKKYFIKNIYDLYNNNTDTLGIQCFFDYKKHFIVKDKDYINIVDYDIMDIYPFIELFYNNKKELIENITIEPNNNCIYIKFKEYVKKEWFENFKAITLITFENEKVKIQFDYSIRFDTKHNFVFIYPNQNSVTINYY